MFRRLNRGDDRLHSILQPLCVELKEKKIEMPKTVVYGTLETISSCYAYFESYLKQDQYYPDGAPAKAENRLFTQYHASYPPYEQERIIKEVVKEKSRLRILFVTVAFGMGMDCPDIRRVIHIGVPMTVEEYFQEAGRAGRDGKNAEATIYYNSYDISRAKKAMQNTMRVLVSSSTCRRQTILEHFGYDISEKSSPLHLCCDVDKAKCQCCECLAEHFDESLHTSLSDFENKSKEGKDMSEVVHQEGIIDLQAIRDELELFRMGLMSGRSCVGSVSLSSGFSINLIDAVLEHIHQLNSPEDRVTRLPVFSLANAEAIYSIISKYK